MRKESKEDTFNRMLRESGRDNIRWKLLVDVGKPSGHNPLSKRSYVGVTLEDLENKKSYTAGLKGSFSKAEAFEMAKTLLKSLLARVEKPKRSP